MNLKDVESNPNYVFIHGDIGDEKLLRKVLPEYQPDAVVNFAAESHVDRSIVDPDSFVRTNVMGTSILLRCVKDWWNTSIWRRRVLSASITFRQMKCLGRFP